MADTTEPRKRWDTDDPFTGVADASSFAPAIAEVAALARRPGWVAEEPETHLIPHLRGTDVTGLRLLHCHTADNGVLCVTAEYSAADSRRDIRQRAWALIGAIAEPAASVREHPEGAAVVFDIVTGIPEARGQFATHGHTLRLALIPPAPP
jgi:hypothetical protein